MEARDSGASCGVSRDEVFSFVMVKNLVGNLMLPYEKWPLREGRKYILGDCGGGGASSAPGMADPHGAADQSGSHGNMDWKPPVAHSGHRVKPVLESWSLKNMQYSSLYYSTWS